MLNRRHIRVKVLHALYAFFQSHNDDIIRGEKELFHSIDKSYEMYISMLQLLVELKETAWQVIEERKQKRLPTKEDLNPNTKFIENQLLVMLQENINLSSAANKFKINWQTRHDLVRRLFLKFSQGNEYLKYMATESRSFKEDKELLVALIEEYIAPDEDLRDMVEEDSIYFSDDWVVTINAMIRTLDLFNENSVEGQRILSLYKDPEDDAKYAKDLFRKSIMQSEENDKLIVEKVKNWEIERLATIDLLLIKMAIAEITTFQNIPIKVSMNEYIELSKIYSTPQSKSFVNGLLDKIVADLKAQGKIVKTGRGLIE